MLETDRNGEESYEEFEKDFGTWMFIYCYVCCLDLIDITLFKNCYRIQTVGQLIDTSPVRETVTPHKNKRFSNEHAEPTIDITHFSFTHILHDLGFRVYISSV